MAYGANLAPVHCSAVKNPKGPQEVDGKVPAIPEIFEIELYAFRFL